jgi:hypothetical protein
MALTLIAVLLVAVVGVGRAQSTEDKKPTAAAQSSSNTGSASKADAARVIRERRARARLLLITLASDARSFRDQTLRARTLARIADALWDADAERGRELFRKAWEAAEVADREGRQRQQEDIRQQKAKSGSFSVSSPPNLPGEVLRLAAKRDRALGEEFLDKLKDEREREVSGLEREKPGPLSSPETVRQRLALARQLLDGGDVERALQFADPVLGTVTMDALNFLSFLREKDSAAADRRYAALLPWTEANAQSDANTVSLLSSYVFTPHLFITFGSDGGTNTSQMSGNIIPATVAPELSAAFLSTAAQVLSRPLPPPEQDQTSSGRQGKYMVIKRLLPLFEQYASKETAAQMRAQLDVLSTAVPEDARQREDEWLRKGLGPEQKSEDREQSLLDRVERAKTSEERDQLYLQLAMAAAQRADLRARDYLDKIDDAEMRKQARAFIDAGMAMQAIGKKDTDRALELSRTGELTHIQRVWVLTQAAQLLGKSDLEKSLALIDQAAEEARRIEGSDADRPRALLAVANALLRTDRARAWEATFEAIKAANSADGFTGEDGRLTIRLQTKGINSLRTNSSEDFDVTGIFDKLANEDAERAVELARGFQIDAPRASAVIAIARAMLRPKEESSRPEKRVRKN